MSVLERTDRYGFVRSWNKQKGGIGPRLAEEVIPCFIVGVITVCPHAHLPVSTRLHRLLIQLQLFQHLGSLVHPFSIPFYKIIGGYPLFSTTIINPCAKGSSSGPVQSPNAKVRHRITVWPFIHGWVIRNPREIQSGR